MDLFFRVEEPFGLNQAGLTFGFESVLTHHHQNQNVRGSATDMAHENEDKVELFFKKLQAKLQGSLSINTYMYWRKNESCRARDLA